MPQVRHLLANLGRVSKITANPVWTSQIVIMPQGLERFQDTGRSHFITFSSRHREAKFLSADLYDLFLICLEAMRHRFDLRVYGYVVMPEHVHILISEPEQGTLAEAIHYLKLSFSKRARGLACLAQVSVQEKDANLGPGSFWEKRYYDRNVRDGREFSIKLRYLHRNPVKRGLVKEPGDWKWSSFRHYALREKSVVEIESEWTARDRELLQVGGPPRIFLWPK